MDVKQFLHTVVNANAEVMAKLGSGTVLVALSGGADSVALLLTLLESRIDCRAAHCNFHLRGEESLRDERFVRNLCQRLSVPLFVRDFNVAGYQQEHGGSTEMACRELRYAWFEQLRQQQGCALIAVAHHADDQVETFFLNLLRGTGSRGLSGMTRLNGNIWRPLLDVSRKDIIDYLKCAEQDYATDSTNAENDYRRNRLRNIVMPVLEEQFPNSRERIIDTMNNLEMDHKLLSSLVDYILPDELHIDIAKLCTQHHAPTLLYHRIRNMGFNHDQCVQAITAAQQGHCGRQFSGNGFVMYVNRRTIDIEPIDNKPDIEIPINLSDGVATPVHISVSRNNAPFSPLMCDGKLTVAFNSQLLTCQRVVLRHWRQGDRMRPFGLNGSKLVSDLFTDFKLDHAAKRDVWLLEADGDILWLLGYRASALYSIEKDSQDYLLLSLI